MPIQLISTDFDGTLFAEFENPPVPLRLQKMLGKLQAQGAKWVINTGRDMSSLMETLGRANLSVEPDYLVLVEREIYLHSDSQYLGLEEWNSSCATAHAELFARVRADIPRLVSWINARFHAMLYEDAFSPFCMIAGNNTDAECIHAFLDEYCLSVPDLTVVRNDVYARFSHAGYNKGTALAELARRLGIPKSSVFAIGDHLNDLPMLSRRYAHLLACPANAIEPVRTAVQSEGGFVSRFSQGYGVADALEFYLSGPEG